MRGSSSCEISCSLVEDDAEKPKKEASDATVTFTVMSGYRVEWGCKTSLVV